MGHCFGTQSRQSNRPGRLVTHFGIAALATAMWFAPALAFGQSFSIGRQFTGTQLSSAPSGRIPPDTMGAVGPNHVAELINTSFAVYDKNGGLQTRVSLDSFWNTAFTNSGAGTTANLAFDPRIIYDPASSRWYAAAVDTRDSANSRVLIGVTTGSDPSTSNWHGFAFDADASDQRWADFPTMGLNADGLFVSANMFPIGGSGSGLVNVWGVPKSSLTAGTPNASGSVSDVDISPSNTGFSVQPALDMTDSSLPLPALSAYNKPAGSLKTSQFPSDFFTTGTLDTSGGFIGVSGRASPPDAHQPGPDDNVETNDNRFSGNAILQQTPGRPNPSLWGVHTVEYNARAALEWYEIDATTNGLLQSGLVSDPSLDLYYPSIAVNAAGDVVIGFSGSDDETPISSYAVVGETASTTTTLSPITLLAAGSGTYLRQDSIDRNRWGDYSATVVDPSNPGTFWTFQEIVSGTNNWAIHVSEIVFDTAAIPEPGSLALAIIGGLFAFFSGGRRPSGNR